MKRKKERWSRESKTNSHLHCNKIYRRFIAGCFSFLIGLTFVLPCSAHDGKSDDVVPDFQAGSNPKSNPKSHAKPNFVWIISEDNSKHFLKLFDDHGSETPNIEAMARHGIVFKNAFSNGAVCSVARSTLITGCYGPRIGTQFHRRSSMVPMPIGLKMFPTYLRQAGYYTTNRSKTDYNVTPGPDVWDDSSRTATWKNRDSDQPFFHKQTLKMTHEGSLHFSKTAMQQSSTQTDQEGVFVAPHHPDTDTFRYTYARYHDQIRKMDQAVGKIIKELESDGLLKSTFVFYFGDHGGVLPGSKGYAYETGLHVPLVVRVPEKYRDLVSDDQVDSEDTPSRSCNGFVSFIDFGPTVLNLAGVKLPSGMDGRPFLGPDTEWKDVNSRDETFGYADRFDEKIDFVRTVRKGRYKYVRNYQPFNFDGMQNNYRYKMLAYRQWREKFRSGELNDAQSRFFKPRSSEELYDIDIDPYETVNLANNPKHQAKLRQLRLLLCEQVKSLPDLSFYPESVLVRDAFHNPVKFGNDHRGAIAKLVDIADLSLIKYSDARIGIGRAINNKDAWQRYWGWIACSCFKKDAKEFVEQAKTVVDSDPEILVRIKAAEFLAIVGEGTPGENFVSCLNRSKSAMEVLLILNSVVMLRDGPSKCKFELEKVALDPKVAADPQVKRRMEYLKISGTRE